MVGFWGKLFGRKTPPALDVDESVAAISIQNQPIESEQNEPLIKSVYDLEPVAFAGQGSTAPWQQSLWDGEKYYGGFGATQIWDVDYWTLRERSAQLFTDNLYARGLIRRLITNEINTGLTPEASPDEEIIGLPEDSLTDWTETVENRFGIWSKLPLVCDWRHQSTFGALQRAARMEALISGDVLVVLRQSPQTKLPKVQLISGSMVRSPLMSDMKIRKGHKIKHGVELDAQHRVAAYWVAQEAGGIKRLPAYGEKSGRRLAWLVFGTEKRLDEVRGQPLLSLVLQSLKEIDRYRDAAARKAVINSILAMLVTKSEDRPGSKSFSLGVNRKGNTTAADSDGGPRSFDIANQVPGLIIEEMQTGEDVVLKGGDGTDVNFGVFEDAIIRTVAWANELPPEILRLGFTNNYSASQAAINEFKIYLNKIWMDFGETFCSPIYTEWLLAETLLQKISAPGLLEAWRNPQQYDKFGAWILTDWYGSIKPATDTLKQGKGSKMLLEMGLSTHAREARGATGTKWTKNMKRLKRENELLVETKRPLAEFEKEFGKAATAAAAAMAGIAEDVGAVLELVEGANE